LKIAVIDIGTNSIHMLMADILPNFSYEVIGREKDMTRLGDGTLANGFLSAEVMERGLRTLKKFHHLAKTKGIRKIIAVATSAVREAENGGDFIRTIYKEIGLKVRVITGEEEGRLIYLGVKHSLDLKKDNTLIIDIGGGSVEVMVVNPRKILLLKSLKMGAARLKELFIKTESPKEIDRLEKFVTTLLKDLAPQVQRLGFSQAIGTSGTLNNLAAMAHYGQSEDGETGQRTGELSFEDLKRLYRLLLKTSPEERTEMRGLDPKRNDLIVGGAAATYVLMKCLNIESITVIDKAIREGMIYEYIGKNRVKLSREMAIPNVRRRNVLRLAYKCKYEQAHAEQAVRLSLQLFDKTQGLHGLSGVDRELLEYAALLHDIGYHISYEKHHLHAYYLIRNVVMNGFSEDEIELIALVVRYHRASLPKKNHKEYQKLSKAQRRRVDWLGGILRLADALDRTHFSVVEGVSVKSRKKNVEITLLAKNDAEYELWDAKRKCDLLEEVSGRKISFILRKVSSLKELALLSA